MPSEFFRTKDHIEFLGYSLFLDKVSIKKDTVDKIKRQISYLLYRNLIQPIKTVPFKAVRIPSSGEDPDFVTAIMQIRRYLYGNLNEEKLRNYLNGASKKLSFKGIMSYYPLIDDEDQLKKLDGWLISTILHILKLRHQILLSKGYRVKKLFPFNLTSHDILEECKRQIIKGKKGLVEIPSFLRIYKAIKMGLINDGIERTINPASDNYDY